MLRTKVLVDGVREELGEHEHQKDRLHREVDPRVEQHIPQTNAHPGKI